jgi:hypothetical protein
MNRLARNLSYKLRRWSQWFAAWTNGTSQIRRTRQLRNPEAPFSVHMVTCHRHVDMALWCLKSFSHFSQASPLITIHDDGSLTEADIELLEAHLSRCRVIARLEADERMDDVLKGHPRCRQMRREPRFYCALKLFDIWVYSRSDSVVAIDSDILFFQRPRELLECIQTDRPCFNSDFQNAYATTPEKLRRRMGIEVRDRVNAGLFALPRRGFDLDLLERYFASFPKPIPELNRHEQTAYALLLSRAGAQRLSDRYQISQQPLRAETVSHHFVSNASRIHFFTRGLKALRRSGVVAAMS